MLRMHLTVISLFLIIGIEKINSASVREKEIGDTARRELEFKIINGNSTFETRSRTKRRTKDEINEIIPYSRVKRHHRHHKHLPGKSYVKLPTGIFVYIKKYDDMMEGFQCGRNGTKTILLDLDSDDYEHKLMANEMQSTIKEHDALKFSKYNITKIQRVINGCLMRRYKRRQEIIKSEFDHLNERIFFHGTNKVDELLSGGFDERYANIDGMFGAGMYFAKHSSKSNQYAFGYRGKCALHGDRHCMICQRNMMICRVTLGNIHMVRHARRHTPHPPPGYHSLEGVASNTTKGLKYNEYIIYRGEQAYPEYVITYNLIP